MKSAPNEKNAQRPKSQRPRRKGWPKVLRVRTVDGTDPGHWGSQLDAPRAGFPAEYDLVPFKVPIAFKTEQAECDCDICVESRAKSKRLDQTEAVTMVLIHTVLANEFLEAALSGISPRESIAYARKHLKKAEQLAEGLLRV